MVFIHGGWWQRNSRQVFSCMAEGPLACGIDVALVGYTLAPEASLTEIGAEIAAALDWLAAREPVGSCVLSGWSAGGHLRRWRWTIHSLGRAVDQRRLRS